MDPAQPRERLGVDPAAISLGAGVMTILLGAAFSLARLGFSVPLAAVGKAVGLGIFLTSLPVIWYRLCAWLGVGDRWFASAGFGWLLGLMLAMAAGTVSGALLPGFIGVGALAWFIALVRCMRSSGRRRLWLLVGTAVFSIWVAGLSWGYGYSNPLFLESIATRTAPKTVIDTLFHTSIANMIQVHGIPSTGLDGPVLLRYHIGSHWLFGHLAKLLGCSLFEFYQFGFPVLMLPLFFSCLLGLGLQLTRFGQNQGAPGNVVPGPWFWAVFVGGVIGVLPVEAQHDLAIGWWRPISESYTVSLVVAFGLLTTLAAFCQAAHWRNASFGQVSHVLLLLLVMPLCVALSGFIKSSTMSLLVIGIVFAYLRLALYRNALWSFAVFLVVAVSMLCTWLMRIPGMAQLSPFHFLRTYVHTGWLPLWVVGYYLGIWLLAAYRFKQHGVRSLAGLRSHFRNRTFFDLELLLVVAAAGFVPGALVAISGASTGYFSDPQRWLAVAALLAIAAAYRPAPSASDVGGSIWHRPLPWLGSRLAGGLLAGVVVANMASTSMLFARSNLATRKALAESRSPGRLLGLDGTLRRKLASNPAYQQLAALRELDGLPMSEKRSSLLFVPRHNEVYWNALPECLAPPFLGPALAGMAMMDGLTNEPCDRQRLGYWSYRARVGGWGTHLEAGRECERAARLGFASFFRLDPPSSRAASGGVVGVDCSPPR